MKFFFKLITKPIGCIFSLIFSLLFLFVVLVVGGIVAFDHFAGEIAAAAVKSTTGFTLTYAKQDVNLFEGSMDFEGLQITNPSRFQVPGFVNFNQVSAKVDMGTLTKTPAVVENVLVDLKTVTIVKGPNDTFNALDFANAAKKAAGQSMAPATGNTTAAGNTTAPSHYLIKSLTIKIGTIEYYDTGSTTPKTYAVNYNKTFTDVTDVNAVAMTIAKDFAAQGMKFMANVIVGMALNFNTYEDAAKSLLNGVGDAGNAVLKNGQGAVKGLGNSLGKLFN
jgi:hypothetical protein